MATKKVKKSDVDLNTVAGVKAYYNQYTPNEKYVTQDIKAYQNAMVQEGLQRARAEISARKAAYQAADHSGTNYVLKTPSNQYYTKDQLQTVKKPEPVKTTPLTMTQPKSTTGRKAAEMTALNMASAFHDAGATQRLTDTISEKQRTRPYAQAQAAANPMSPMRDMMIAGRSNSLDMDQRKQAVNELKGILNKKDERPSYLKMDDATWEEIGNEKLGYDFATTPGKRGIEKNVAEKYGISEQDARNYLTNYKEFTKRRNPTETETAKDVAEKYYDIPQDTWNGIEELSKTYKQRLIRSTSMEDTELTSIVSQIAKQANVSAEDARFLAENFSQLSGMRDNHDYQTRKSEKLVGMSGDQLTELSNYVKLKRDYDYAKGSLEAQPVAGRIESELNASRQRLKELGLTDDDIAYAAQYRGEFIDAAETYQMENRYREWINENGAAGGTAATAAEIITSPVQGLAAMTEVLNSLGYADKTAPINTNSGAYRLQNVMKAGQEQVNENIYNYVEETTGSPSKAKLASFVYGASVSTAESIENAVLGGALVKGMGLTGKAAKIVGNIVTLPSFGASAFTTTLQEAQRSGMGKQNALTVATGAGIAEMLTEVVSLDKVWDTYAASQAGNATAKWMFTNALVGAGIEGSEEGASDLINQVVDIAVNQGLSDYGMAKRNYMNAGMSERDASLVATQDFIKQMAEDVAAGVFSGGLSNIGSAAAGYTQSRILASAVEKSAATKQAVYEAAEKLPEGSPAKEIVSEKEMDLVDASDIETIVKEVAQDTDELKAVIGESMEEKGMTKEQATQVADREIQAIIDMVAQEAVEEQEIEESGTVIPLEYEEEYEEVYDGNGITEYDPEAYNRENGFGPVLYDEETGEELVYDKPQTLERSLKEENGEKKETSYVSARTAAEQALDNRRKLTVIDHGKNRVSVNGKTESVAKFVNAKEGKAIVQLESGKTVSLSDVDFKNESDQRLFEAALGFEDTDAANVFLENYNGEPVTIYKNAAMAMYYAGHLGQGFERTMNNSLNAYVTRMVNRETLQKMYSAGWKQFDQRQTKSRTTRKENKNAGKVTGEQVDARMGDFLTRVAEITGLEYHITDAEDFYGAFQASMGRVLLSNNSDLYSSFIHETLGEMANAYNREGFDDAINLVMDYVANEKGAETLQKEIEAHWNAYKAIDPDTTIEDAAKEYTCDFLASLFRTEEGQAQLIDWATRRYGMQKTRDIWTTIADFFKDIAKKIRDYINSGRGNNENLIALRAAEEQANEIRETALSVLDEAITSYATARVVDANEDAVVFSQRTRLSEFWAEAGFKSYEQAKLKVAKAIAKQNKVSLDTAKTWIEAEESLASYVLADKEYLDFEPDQRYEAIKKNADYPQGTVDLSNLCRKREIFTRMFEGLQKQFPDTLFNAQDIADIREILRQSEMETACALCYVEDRRQKMGEIADNFIGYYKKALGTESKEIFKVNYKGEEKSLKASKAQIEKYGLSVKEGDDAVYFYATDEYVPNQYDLVTYEGFKKLQQEHPNIAYAFENYNNSRGMASARLIEGHAEYKREILKYSKKTIEKINSLGGLRIFSFSDFEAVHLLDLAQVITDCSAKGIMIQAYTKVPEFAKLVENTGIKLNVSAIPAGTGLKEVNGKKVLDFDNTEGIDTSHKYLHNLFNEGDNEGSISRDNPNIGIVLVGISDEQIAVAMLDDRISYIIPFHTGQRDKVLETKGISHWYNYKLEQEDKDLSGEKRKKKGINIYTDVMQKYNPKTEREFTEAFLQECKQQQFEPRFSRFLEKNTEPGRKADYYYRPGYAKLLVDFKLFDRQGNILPQGKVIPEINTEVAKEIMNKDAERSRNMKFPEEIKQKIREKMIENGKDLDDSSKTLEAGTEKLSFSVPVNTENYAAEEDASILQEGIEALKNTTIDEKATGRIAKSIVKKYGSNYPSKELQKNLNALYAYMKSYGATANDVTRIITEIARPVLEQSTAIDAGEKAVYDEFRATVKKTPIKLNEKQKEEVANAYDSYNEFRKKTFGMITLKNDGAYLDTVWSELVEASGNVLSSDISDTDMPLALIDYMQSIKPVPTNVYGDNIEEAVYDVGLEILGRFYEEETTGKAERKVQQYGETVKEYRQQVRIRERERANERIKQEKERLERSKDLQIQRLTRELKDLSAEEREAIRSSDIITQAEIQAEREEAQKRIEDIRNRSADQVAKLKARQQSSALRRADSARKTKLKEQLRRNWNTLNQMLANPTEKRHVPEDLAMSLIDFLDTINMDNGSNAEMREKVNRFRDMYRRFRAQQLEETGVHDYGLLTQQTIDSIAELFNGRSYADLDTGELAQVLRATKEVMEQIRNANMVIDDQKKRAISETAQEAIKDVKQAKQDAFKLNGGPVNTYFTWHLDGTREFRKLAGYKDGSAMMDLLKKLQEGQMRVLQVQRESEDIFRDVLEGKENQKEAERLISTKKEDMVDVGIRDDDGKPVMVTRAMRLSLIMHMMNQDNIRHITGEGVVVPDMKLYEKGEFTKAFDDKHAKTYQLVDRTWVLDMINKGDYKTVQEKQLDVVNNIRGMEDDLTEYEKKFLSCARKFFTDYTGKKINETSRKLTGYSIARVKNYFPIKSDPNFVGADISNLTMDSTLTGAGVLKNRVRSRNAIYLEGIDKVIQRQTDFVSKYAGFAIPVRNINAVVKAPFRNEKGKLENLYETIGHMWGPNDKKFVENLLADVQGGRHADDSGFNGFMNNMRGRYASAILTANIGVAMKQAASYPTAAAVVGWRTLIRAAKDVPKGFAGRGIEELEKRNPLLWYRNKGNSTEELGDLKSKGIADRMPKAMKTLSVNLIQNVDTGIVRTLEYASMYYVDREYKGLEKGSDEYWNKVSEIFTRVVTETQPNYTTMQRPDVLRNQNAILKQVVMFKTQPLQNFQIVYDAVGNWNAKVQQSKRGEATKEDVRKAVKGFAEAVSSQVGAALVFSAISIVADIAYHKWWKYKDDDGKMEEKVKEAIISGSIKTLMSAMLFGDQLYSWIDGLLLGGTNYGMSVGVVDTVNELYDNISSLTGHYAKLTDSTMEADINKNRAYVKRDVKNLSLVLAQWLGVPANTIFNSAESIYLYANDIENQDWTFSSELDTPYNMPTQKQMISEALENGDRDRATELANQYAEWSDKGDDTGESIIKSMVKSNLDTRLWGAIDGQLSSGKGTGKTYKADEILGILKEYEKEGLEVKTGTITSHYKQIYLDTTGPDKASMKNLLIQIYVQLDATDAKDKHKKWSELIDKWE